MYHKALYVLFLGVLFRGELLKAENSDLDNPMTVFCGVRCQRCDYSSDFCKAVLAKNLQSLCDDKDPERNCFLLWQNYTKVCDRLCTDEELRILLEDEIEEAYT